LLTLKLSEVQTPDKLTDDQAATIPLASITAVMGLFREAGIPFPTGEGAGSQKGKAIVILGGSSSVGQYG